MFLTVQATLQVIDDEQYTHILRIQNTNVKGHVKAAFALKGIKGIGRRFANIVLKVAGIDLDKRAGQITEAEIDHINDILARPTQHGIPKWMLNRQHCPRDGTWSQMVSSGVDTKYREDLEKLKKIKQHKGLRHFWGLKVRGQRTYATGRRGRTLGVIKKK